MVLHCGSTSPIKPATNPIYHEKTKHVGIDCHFIREKVEVKDMVLAYASKYDQVADILTEEMSRKHLNNILSKLPVVNIYTPA